MTAFIALIKKAYRRIRLFYKIFLRRKYTPIDLWFWEKGDETYRLNYDLNPDCIVFDLGGFKGEWAEKIYKLYQPNILIFEPVSAFQEIISSKIQNFPKIKLFNFGLGGISRTDTITLNDNGSSTHRRDVDSMLTEEIKIVGIEHFFKETKINHVDLMKINIEGEEYALLFALIGQGLQKRIKNIQIQFHPWVENAESMRLEIREVLSQTHRPSFDFPFVWENWERVK